VEVDKLRFTPRVPANWKSFKLNYRYRETTYQISVVNTSDSWAGSQKVWVDGQEQSEPLISLVDDRRVHQVEVRFG
jgi:cellobiose phosphorylase